VLLLACDLPQLQAEVLETWAAELSNAQGAIALLPKNPEGWWEPLCGFYRRDSLASLEAYVAGGGRSFQRWIKQQGSRVGELEVSHQEMLLNCNTPEDLSQLSTAAPTTAVIESDSPHTAETDNAPPIANPP
jgi:molybdenum cofactor guanylyltransferase